MNVKTLWFIFQNLNILYYWVQVCENTRALFISDIWSDMD